MVLAHRAKTLPAFRPPSSPSQGDCTPALGKAVFFRCSWVMGNYSISDQWVNVPLALCNRFLDPFRGISGAGRNLSCAGNGCWEGPGRGRHAAAKLPVFLQKACWGSPRFSNWAGQGAAKAQALPLRAPCSPRVPCHCPALACGASAFPPGHMGISLCPFLLRLPFSCLNVPC